MALRRVLDAPIGQLSLWMSREASQEFPDHCRGKCAATLRQWSADQVASLLQQAAEIRLRSKAAGFEARARRAGWEQALWRDYFEHSVTNTIFGPCRDWRSDVRHGFAAHPTCFRFRRDYSA
jgi:hypothetical protein